MSSSTNKSVKLSLTFVCAVCFWGLLTVQSLLQSSLLGLCLSILLFFGFAAGFCSKQNRWDEGNILIIASLILCILQAYNVLFRQPVLFSLLFGNHSALFGGIMSLGAIVVFEKMLSRRNQARTCSLLLAGCFVVLLTGVLLTKSRISFLAVIAGCFYLLATQCNIKRKKPLLITFAIFVPTLCYCLYCVNPDSIKGRLLIWEVITESPSWNLITGNGIHSFPSEYMYWQADFFENNPLNEGVAFADNVNRPYNDYLRILTEQGVPALLLFLMALCSAVFIPMPGTVAIEKALLIAGAVLFSCSYPIESPVIILVLSFCAGKIVNSSVNMIQSSLTVGAYIFLVAGLVLIPVTNHAWRQYGETDKRAQIVHIECSPSESLPVLQQACSVMPSTQLLCDLGDCYMACGDHDKAIASYRKASWMVPRRILPRYKLFEYYRVNENQDQAMRIAREILQYEPYYIRGTIVIRILAEIHNYLETIEE